MHDMLRNRLLRRIESLPEDQVYQVLDFIEFLEVKYGAGNLPETSGLQRFAERLEDRLRRGTVSPSSLREAFQLISAADRVLGGVSEAGRKILEEIQDAPGSHTGRGERGPADETGAPAPGLTPGSRSG